MQKLSVMFAALFLSLGLAAPASASTFIYTAIMAGAFEVPAVATTASGFATLTLTGDSLTISESFTGLTATPTGAHIHCCILPGGNAAVAIPFPSFPSAVAGTYTNTFDLTLASTYTSAFITASGGTAAAAEAALIAGLNSNQAYVNIHDANFPGGEIRGLLAPTPEPQSLTLLGTGLLGVVHILRRRRLALNA